VRDRVRPYLVEQLAWISAPILTDLVGLFAGGIIGARPIKQPSMPSATENSRHGLANDCGPLHIRRHPGRAQFEKNDRLRGRPSRRVTLNTAHIGKCCANAPNDSNSKLCLAPPVNLQRLMPSCNRSLWVALLVIWRGRCREGAHACSNSDDCVHDHSSASLASQWCCRSRCRSQEPIFRKMGSKGKGFSGLHDRASGGKRHFWFDGIRSHSH
jgi:hypothetical protein